MKPRYKCLNFFPLMMLAAVVFCISNQPLFAQSTNWIGGVGNWDDPANWDNGVPQPTTSNIAIGNDGVATILGPFDLNTGSLSLGTSDGIGELVIDGTGGSADLRLSSMVVGSDPTGSSRLTVLAGGDVSVQANLSINGFVDVAGGELGANNILFEGGHTVVRDGGSLAAGFSNTRIGSGFFQTRLDVTDNSTARFNSSRSILFLGPGDGVEFGASSLVVLANGGSLNAFGSMWIEAGGELRFGDGELAGSVDTDWIQNDNLIRLRHTGLLNLETPIIGRGRILSDETGTTLLSGLENFAGTIQADRGQIQVGGTLYQTDAFRTGSQGQITFRNADVHGGFLRGSGIFELAEDSPNMLSGMTSFNSTLIEQRGSTTLRNFTHGGTLRNHHALVLDGFNNAASGRLEIQSLVSAVDLASSGIIDVGFGGVLNVNDSDLVAGGGSRTSIQEGGWLSVSSGNSIELNGGLLVNNGEIAGVLNVNYGSLAKGAGDFDVVNVNDGGIFAPGNSPDQVMMQSLTLNAGADLQFEIRDMLGTAGEDHDQILLDQLVLRPGSTGLSMITLSILSLGLDDLPGLAENFDVNGNYSFAFLVVEDGIEGFDPSRIRLDTSGFLNAIDSTQFWLASDGNVVSINYSAVPEPGSGSLLWGIVLLSVWRRPARR